MQVLVVGGGIFGATATLALRARGFELIWLDRGALPHPLAESTDLSKVVRIDYGADEDYTALGERALDGWRSWNARWRRPLFHETGVAFLARSPMQVGGFEHESFALLTRRGHRLERLDSDAITRRFPAYRHGAFVDGYFHASGGWASASAVIEQLAHEAIAAGALLREGTVTRIVDEGALLATGELVRADLVVVCTGSWAPLLVPELAGHVRAIGQPVFHLRPQDPTRYVAERFPVFGADISRTGYYGFPVTDGVVKIANHGAGIELAPEAGASARTVTAAQEAALRELLADVFPALSTAPIVHRRLCVYGDTADEHFWIARHPTLTNLAVATGGSGHAFKFAPVLGELIATIVLAEPHPLATKFGWRTQLGGRQGCDAARHRA
jgi:glycine/D-amino acid oxidase-like deaminating enzyme